MNYLTATVNEVNIWSESHQGGFMRTAERSLLFPPGAPKGLCARARPCTLVLPPLHSGAHYRPIGTC